MHLAWLLLSFEGRINRAKYLVAVLVTFCWQIFWVTLWAVFGEVFGLATSHLAETILPIPFSFEFVNDDPPWKAALFTLFATIPINVSLGWAMAASLVKRLHDRNRSGWWAILLYGVPYLYLHYIRLCFDLNISIAAPTLLAIFSIPIYVLSCWYVIELYFLMGTDGRNRFGPDPLSSVVAGAPPHPRPDQRSVPGFLVQGAGPLSGSHAGRQAD
jgi:uncharacterized membrane protein YhaH (DUF805 family)